MKRSSFGAYSITALLLLSGCSQQLGPTHQELKLEFSEQISPYIDDFELKDTENLGTQTEPIVQSRYRATLKYTEENITTPEILENLRKRDQLGKAYSEVHGLSRSTRKGSTWETRFTIEESNDL